MPTDVSLDFSSAISGTLVDKDGEGTGFTSVQANTADNAYDLGRIDLNTSASILALTATQGSNASANTLKNALQVPISASTQPFTISTRLKGPFTNLTEPVQQGGIFLGSDQDNYVKFVIANAGKGTSDLGLQFYQEQNQVLSSVGGGSAPQVIGLDWANISTLDLFLKGDPATGAVTAAYRVNSDTATPTPLAQQFTPNPTTSFFADETTARAGILAFTLNSPDTQVTFDNFGIQYSPNIKINFQPDTSAVPAGYIKDIGEGYSDNIGFGWVQEDSLSSATATPVSIETYARQRNRSGVDPRLDTVLQMQYPGTPPATWEYAVPNGTYSVTVSAGDQPRQADGVYDSINTINVEGVNAIQSFQSTPNQEYQQATVEASVTDGKLTIDAIGGINTKINFIEVSSVTPVVANSPNIKINFQPSTAAVPAGYIADSGEAYDPTLGFGWVTQDTLSSATATPLSIETYARQRNRSGVDPRLDTVLQMQYSATPPAAWEYAVPNGTYSVTVSAGDQPRQADGVYDSINTINVEGVNAIRSFQSTPNQEYQQATVEASVTDGKLTIDAIGGINTKINFIEVSSVIPDFTTINWSTAAPSPIGRAEGLGMVADEKLYVFGGYIDSTFNPTKRSDVYDPATNTWTQIVDMPKAVTHVGTAVDGKDIYFAGGYEGKTPGASTYGGQIFATKDVWKYNVDTNTWTAMPALPFARGSGELAVLDGQLHFFGGADINRVDKGDHWVLSLDGGTSWTTSAPLANPRNHMGDAVIDGKIYAIGGQQGFDRNLVAQNSVEVWNPAQPNTWTAVASLPKPRSHISSSTFVIDDRIIVAGGEIAHTVPMQDVTAYDPVSNTWTELTPLPAELLSGVAGSIGNQIFFTTGSPSPGFTTTTYKGMPANDDLGIQSAPPPALVNGSSGNIEIVTPDAAIVQNRMVFSTVNEEARPPKTLTLRNTSTEPLTITELTFGDSYEQNNAVRLADHQRAADFSFVNAPTLPLTLDPGASLDLDVLFAPQRVASLDGNDLPTHLINGENYASLTITSDDPDQPTMIVNLAGVNAEDYEGTPEPTVAEIARTFGWTLNVGTEDRILGGSKTLLGDEVYSPYWLPADSTKPVELWPVAVYSDRTDRVHTRMFFEAKPGSGGNSGSIYRLAGTDNDDNVSGSNDLSGGENQKLLPKILVDNVNTVPTASTVDFTPTSAFALRYDGIWTDDSMNGTYQLHNWRTFPVRDANGTLIPNTWFAVADPGQDPDPTTGKNFDYNDGAFLLVNAKPEEPALDPSVAGPLPGAAGLVFDFNTTYQGSLTDKDGETIGFTSTQPNKNQTFTTNTSYFPRFLDVNTSGLGTLTVTTYPGSNGTDDNTLINALQSTFDGRAGKSTISSTLVGPLSNITTPVQQGGVMFGPDQDNFIKLVAIAQQGGTLGLQFYSEQKGVGTTIGPIVPISSPQTLQSLELMLLTDPQTGTVQAGYRAISPTSDTGMVVLPESLVLKGGQLGHYFDAQSKAGIITTSKFATPIAVTFDRFAITPA